MPDMLGLSRSRTIFALAAVLVTTLAVWLAAGIEAAGIALVGAAVAALIAAPPVEHAASDALLPAPADDSVADAIEAIFEPVLHVAENRVIAANQAARNLLGEHILGEDVRVAIRHPAAAERLLSTEEASGAPIQLVGLGARDQHWEMRVRTLPGGHRIVHLGDRTGSHAADRIRVDFVATKI